MIAYEVLVQTIADWKAGVRPTAPTPAAPEQVEEVSSGLVDLDEEVGFAAEDDDEAEQGYDSSEYEQPAESDDASEYQEYQQPAETEDASEYQEYQQPAETDDASGYQEYQQPAETYDDDDDR
ncbi:MAG: hypothetical protein R6X02_01190 [Enhygromyxa sp.]